MNWPGTQMAKTGEHRACIGNAASNTDSLLVCEDRGIITEDTLERWETGGRGGQWIMGGLDPDQVFASCGWILGHQTSEAGFQLLIKAFGQAVGLCMVTWGQARLGSDQLTNLPPETWHKLGPPVRDNVLGETMDSEDMVDHDFCSFFSWG